MTTGRWFLGVIDVVGWNGSSTLVLCCLVHPATAVNAVEVDSVARVIELTQRHTAVSRHTIAD